MTKKDYVAIAAAIKKVQNLYTLYGNYNPKIMEESNAIIGTVAISIANALEADNPRFNRDRFLEACLK